MTLDTVLEHYPFFAAAIILGMIGSQLKRVITKKMAEQSKLAWWFRATLPIHPVLAGCTVGYIDVLPTSMGLSGPGGSALYFGLAGAASSWVYGAFKHFVEKRTMDAAPESLKPKRE